MVPKLEAIKGGGGSIKVGTTGTISTLMSRELDKVTSTPQAPLPSIHVSPTESIAVPYQAFTPRKLKPKSSLNEAVSSESSNVNKRSPENARKIKPHNRKTSQLPMLDSDNISVDGTPIRRKQDKKGSSFIVEVVDIKCGHPDRAWASPITNRLKKLGFSKMSESIV